MAGTRCEAFPPLRALPRSSGVCAEVAAPARLRGALRRFLCPTHRHLSNTSLKLHCQPTPWQHSAQQPRFLLLRLPVDAAARPGPGGPEANASFGAAFFGISRAGRCEAVWRAGVPPPRFPTY